MDRVESTCISHVAASAVCASSLVEIKLFSKPRADGSSHNDCSLLLYSEGGRNSQDNRALEVVRAWANGRVFHSRHNRIVHAVDMHIFIAAVLLLSRCCCCCCLLSLLARTYARVW